MNEYKVTYRPKGWNETHMRWKVIIENADMYGALNQFKLDRPNAQSICVTRVN